VEYDGESVSVIVIWGGVFLTPKTGKEAQLGGLKTITGRLNPPLPGTPTLAFALLVYLPFGKINIVLAKYIFKLILPGDS